MKTNFWSPRVTIVTIEPMVDVRQIVHWKPGDGECHGCGRTLVPQGDGKHLAGEGEVEIAWRKNCPSQLEYPIVFFDASIADQMRALLTQKPERPHRLRPQPPVHDNHPFSKVAGDGPYPCMEWPFEPHRSRNEAGQEKAYEEAYEADCRRRAADAALYKQLRGSLGGEGG